MMTFRSPARFAAVLLLSLALTSVYGQEKLTGFVDPFIGTRDMGHTYPGVTVPFGMVQLSPDTDNPSFLSGDHYNKEVYRYCAGYQYGDSTITGFSHTHFSGTGHSDLGDFLIMPFSGEPQLVPGTASRPEDGYRSRFTHQRESARPGYYAVDLLDEDIHAELTATERVGMHRYTYPGHESAGIILDLEASIYNYPGKVIWSGIRVENDTLVTGFRQTRGWARTRYIYFAMSFSKPIREFGYASDEKIPYRGFYRKFNEKEGFPEMAGRDIRAWFTFEAGGGSMVMVKVALSPVSAAGALKNLQAEIPHWDFDRVAADADALWESELSRVRIEAVPAVKTVFYTAMYHAFLGPTVYMDVDGFYRGVDQEIHRAEGFVNYTTFSLWDTYRALHPLFTIVQQQRTGDMVRSMLAHRNQSVHGILPVWSHHANENWCMIGYHAVPVIADAWMKGIRNYDGREALAAMVASSAYAPYDGIGDYMKYGFVPAGGNTNSASKTLEYAYDDWCIQRMASDLGVPDIAREYRLRSRSFEKIFDPSAGFMRPRNADGSWVSPFDPLKTEGQGFIEGNAWNYSLYVPHDPAWLVENAGGPEKFSAHLDSLFSLRLGEEHIAESEDISHAGIIGNYVHGNEPSHHLPYLYVYAGKPWKTQERVREILGKLYRHSPGGLPGNDDCGQMSAWYIFSALGFYPVCPGSNQYVLGSPAVSKAGIRLENGKVFTVMAKDQSPENIYVRKVLLNGRILERNYLSHEEIMAGGELVFEMSGKPEKKAITSLDGRPYSMSLVTGPAY
jgi:predicted alpha-1,2-mannosidase